MVGDRAADPVNDQGTDPTGKIYVLATTRPPCRPAASPPSRSPSAPTSATAWPITLSPSSTDDERGQRTSRSPTCTSTTCSSTPRRSDGVITGMSYEQSIRPLQDRGPAADRGGGTRASSVAAPRAASSKFQVGVVHRASAEGTGADRDPQRSPRSTRDAKTVTLDTPLEHDHAAGEWAGTEFIAVPLVSRRRPRQRLLARPRRRHPRLGHRASSASSSSSRRARPTTTRRRAREVDSGTYRRHPHRPTRWPPGW